LSELLASALDRVRNFLGDFFGAGARIRGDDQRFLDGELGVFQPAEHAIREEPAKQHEHHRNVNDTPPPNGELADVHGPLYASASARSRTFMPSRTSDAPAVTMRSPGRRPLVISSRSPTALPTVTGLRTVVSSLDTIHAAGLPGVSCTTADAGTS